MTPYEFAGAIIRADQVFVFVDYGDGDEDYFWLPVSKNDARLLRKDASDPDRESPCESIDAQWEGRDLYVGGDALRDPDPDPEPEEEEEEEP